jgi:hypothetical protein
VERAPFVARLLERRPNPWLLTLAALPAVVAAALIAVSIATGVMLAVLAPQLLFGSGLALAWALFLKPFARHVDMPVHADAQRLRVGELEIPREQLRDALVVPLRDGRWAVRATRRRALAIELLVRDAAEGRQVLRALGFDASQAVARFRTRSRLFVNDGRYTLSSLVLTVAWVVAFLGNVPHAFLFAVPVLVFLAAVVPTTVEVGADGVVLTWFGRKRFIPCSAIRDVAVYEGGYGNKKTIGAEMTLHGGERVRIPVGSRTWSQEAAAALAERIREAMDAKAHGSIEDAAVVLGREGRSIADWVRALRSVGAGANATLRTAPVPADRLWSIVESPRARGVDRAAAAVALASSEDAEAKTRLRVVADAVAEPKVRVAIDAAARGDDGATEDALDALADEATAAER